MWRRSSVADVVTLFEEYAAAYSRGDRPRAQDYLERAGPAADELAKLIDGWLRAVPVPEPDEETTALVGAWAAGEPPLVQLRSRRGVRVDDVVDAIVTALGLDVAKRAKVKRYYQRLEQGLLDPARVSRRVLAVVKGQLGERTVEGLACVKVQWGERTGEALAWRAPELRVEPAYYRAGPEMTIATGMAAEAEPEDEIDRLFTGGR
jgi:hypothetical protein